MTDEPEADQSGDEQEKHRGTVELPAVVLGEDEEAKAPERRVLQGLIDRRWLSYPAYLACFAGGAGSIRFAMHTAEWSAGPVAIAWLMLFFWEWIYGVAYGYRRAILKYFSYGMVLILSIGLALLSFDRAAAQVAATVPGELVERGAAAGLTWAGIAALVSGAFITAHVVILGRGYREKKERDTVGDDA